MAINPTPKVKIIESLDTSIANPNSIVYTITGQVEPIVSATGRVYRASTGELIFTYYNSGEPASTSEGYLFPMVQIDSETSSSIVTWAQGKTYADWTDHNNEQYYIEISVTGRSGDVSAYSVGELFWAVKSPTATIATIGSSGTVTTTQLTTTTTVDLQQIVATNTVEKYRLILTDVTSNIISQDTGWIYDSGSGSGENYTFTYTFYDLEDTHQYTMQFIAYTQLNSPIEAISNIFTVSTGLVITGTLIAENNCTGGYISTLTTITGTGATGSQIPNAILIQRAIATESTLNWVSVYEELLPSSFAPTTADPTIITYNDYYVGYGASVQYRAVPIRRQGSLTTQGVGIATTENEVSKFNKFFIIDSATRFGFDAGVAYDNLTLNQQTGVHQPLGAIYPIVVRNANTKYRNGGFTVTIMPSDFDDTNDVMSKDARYNMVTVRKSVGDFLTNGAPKIIKDWNGNIWLVEITDNVSASFNNNVGMGLADVNGTWTELGDVYDTDTLVASGLVNVGG